jgi:ribosomal protein S18 acetylase RimI-like enzyme
VAPPLLEIREMDLEDLPAVYALGERLFTAEKWPNLYRTWDPYDLVSFYSEDGEFCLVAEMAGRIEGFALGTLIEKRRSAWVYGYLQWLGVSDEVKRRGVGSRMLDRLTDLFIEHGARMLLVDTEVENEEALEFFRRKGFGNQVEHVFMSRNLSAHPDYLRRWKPVRKRRRRASKAGRRGP